MRFTALFVVALLAAAMAGQWFYYLPDGQIVPAGHKYRVLSDNGNGWKVIQADTALNGFAPHPEKWASGIPVADSGCLAEWVESEPFKPDTNLTAKAIIARAVLSVSPKLKDNAQIQFQLDLLAQAVEMAAGADVTLTAVAVQAIQDILNHPAIKANPDLWQALENARQQVVTVTNGSID